MVIIIGRNRAELCKVPTKDQERHFFQSRGQLYKVYPDALTRADIDDMGRIRTDEIIVFRENALVPYHPHDVDYSFDTLLREVDEHKLMSPRTLLGNAQIFFRKAGNIWKQIVPYIGLIITGVIVAWAFLTG